LKNFRGLIDNLITYNVDLDFLFASERPPKPGEIFPDKTSLKMVFIPTSILDKSDTSKQDVQELSNILNSFVNSSSIEEEKKNAEFVYVLNTLYDGEKVGKGIVFLKVNVNDKGEGG